MVLEVCFPYIKKRGVIDRLINGNNKYDKAVNNSVRIRYNDQRYLENCKLLNDTL